MKDKLEALRRRALQLSGAIEGIRVLIQAGDTDGAVSATHQAQQQARDLASDFASLRDQADN